MLTPGDVIMVIFGIAIGIPYCTTNTSQSQTSSTVLDCALCSEQIIGCTSSSAPSGCFWNVHMLVRAVPASVPTAWSLLQA